MIDARIWFLLYIFRMNGQNLTKFCIHIIIDKIFVGILKCHFFLLICNRVTTRDQEDRQFPVLYRFRIRQTDLFREKRKKIGLNIYLFFGRVPELKYSRSFEMVTFKLHNRSKQSQVSITLSIVNNMPIINNQKIVN